jgi:hypothetical protein
MSLTNIKHADLHPNKVYSFTYKQQDFRGTFIEKTKDFSVAMNPTVTIVFDTFQLTNHLFKSFLVYNLQEEKEDIVFSDNESNNTTDSEEKEQEKEYEMVDDDLKIEIEETDEQYAYVVFTNK